MPCGPALVLNLLRWGGEIRSWEALHLPPQGTQAAGIKDAEMAMAKQLIDEMSASWSADQAGILSRPRPFQTRCVEADRLLTKVIDPPPKSFAATMALHGPMK